MYSSQYANFIHALFLLAVLVVVVPPLYFLAVPWGIRRHKLMAYLDENSARLYFKQFFRADQHLNSKGGDSLAAMFDARYGRGRFLIPLLLLILVSVLCAFAGARTIQVAQRVVAGTHALPWVAASALAGGFTWVAHDLIDRVRSGDLHPSDIYNSVFRILIAIPFGWSLSLVANPAVGVPVAFLLGALPTESLFKYGRRIAASKLGFAEDPETGALELEKLQSVTKTNAERFYDEGVTTIVQLAYTDPIDLTLRTNFDFNYVLDCASQALLWIYFEDLTRGMAIYSVRSAQEALTLVQDLRNDQDPTAQGKARNLLQEMAGYLKLSPEALELTLDQVAQDPYTRFICSVWH